MIKEILEIGRIGIVDNILDILNISDSDLSEKIKKRYLQKNVVIKDTQKKQILEKWMLLLDGMGINPYYLSYKTCPVCTNWFDKVFRYITTMNEKKIFFFASRKTEADNKIVDSFKYSYAIFSKKVVLHRAHLPSVCMESFYTLKEKVKNSNNFKSEDLLSILENACSNDIYFLYVHNSHEMSEPETKVISCLTDAFLASKKVLIICFDADTNCVERFFNHTKERIGRKNISINRMH